MLRDLNCLPLDWLLVVNKGLQMLFKLCVSADVRARVCVRACVRVRVCVCVCVFFFFFVVFCLFFSTVFTRSIRSP